MSTSADSRLNNVAASAVQAFCARKAVSQDKLAVSLIDLSRASAQYGSFRGDEPFYPASVVKLFFLAAACTAIESGTQTPQLRDALRYMIVDSSNDATGYVVDVLTGTTSGAELSDEEMQKWSAKRQSLNDRFAPRGYAGINICQKTWDDAPYGRDKVFVDTGGRNSLTANHTAKLMEAIVSGKIAGPEHTRFMMQLLARDYTVPSDDPDDQATGFCAAALPAGAKLWSKAGWTSGVRHDAAYIELANGARLIMVIFTEGYSNDYRLISELASAVLVEFFHSKLAMQ